MPALVHFGVTTIIDSAKVKDFTTELLSELEGGPGQVGRGGEHVALLIGRGEVVGGNFAVIEGQEKGAGDARGIGKVEVTSPSVASEYGAEEGGRVASDVLLLIPGGLEGKEVCEMLLGQISEGEGREGEGGRERAQIAADVLVKGGEESRGGEGEVKERSSGVGKWLAAPAGVGRQRIAYFGLEVESDNTVLSAEKRKLGEVDFFGALEFGDTHGTETAEVEVRAGRELNRLPAEIPQDGRVHA